MTQVSHDKILIIDFGSQVTQLIARRVREMGVYSEVVPFQKAAEAFARMKPKAVILSGRACIASRGGQPARATGRVRGGRSGAWHLLRPDASGRAARGEGGKRAPPGIWPGGSFGEGAVSAV